MFGPEKSGEPSAFRFFLNRWRQSMCPSQRICQSKENPPGGGFSSLMRGFTMVELIVTIVIVGILALTIMPRWSGNSGFDERGFRDSVVAGLRYAQKSAVAAHRRVCATFTGNSVSFSIAATFADANCATGAPLPGPNGGNMVVTATGGASFSAVPAAIIFDAAGRPVTGSAVLGFANVPAALAVTVEAETGYVH